MINRETSTSKRTMTNHLKISYTLLLIFLFLYPTNSKCLIILAPRITFLCSNVSDSLLAFAFHNRILHFYANLGNSGDKILTYVLLTSFRYNIDGILLHSYF